MKLQIWKSSKNLQVEERDWLCINIFFQKEWLVCLYMRSLKRRTCMRCSVTWDEGLMVNASYVHAYWDVARIGCIYVKEKWWPVVDRIWRWLKNFAARRRVDWVLITGCYRSIEADRAAAVARSLSAFVKTQGHSCIAFVRQRSGFEVEAALCKEDLTVPRRSASGRYQLS